MKLENLTPAQLNQLIALTEGFIPPGDPRQAEWLARRAPFFPKPEGAFWLYPQPSGREPLPAPPNYCGDDGLAAAIAFREKMALNPGKDSWSCVGRHYAEAEDPRIAIARAHVSWKYGETADFEGILEGLQSGAQWGLVYEQHTPAHPVHL